MGGSCDDTMNYTALSYRARTCLMFASVSILYYNSHLPSCFNSPLFSPHRGSSSSPKLFRTCHAPVESRARLASATTHSGAATFEIRMFADQIAAARCQIFYGGLDLRQTATQPTPANAGPSHLISLIPAKPHPATQPSSSFQHLPVSNILPSLHHCAAQFFASCCYFSLILRVVYLNWCELTFNRKLQLAAAATSLWGCVGRLYVYWRKAELTRL